jgi:hypothetical protein
MREDALDQRRKSNGSSAMCDGPGSAPWRVVI